MSSSTPSRSPSVTPTKNSNSYSYIKLIGITVGCLSTRLIFIMIQTLFFPLSTSLRLPPEIRTFLLFFSSFSGFICAPLIGAYSDTCRSKLGRRKPFIIIGSILMTLGIFLMTNTEIVAKPLSTEDTQLANQRIVFVIAYTITLVASNIANSPIRTICFDITPPSLHNLVSNLCSLFSSLGGILVNLIGAFKLYKYTALGQEQFLILTSVIFIVLSLAITIISAKEKPLTHSVDQRKPFHNIFNAIKTVTPTFTRAAVPYVFAQLSLYQFSFLFSHFFGCDIFQGDNSSNASMEKKARYQEGLSWVLVCNTVRFITQFLYALVNTKICDLIGMKIASVIGYFLLAFGLLSFLFVTNKNIYIIISMLIGVGFAITTSIPIAIVSIISPPKENGIYIGLLTMFMVIGEQFSNFVFGKFMDLIGFNDSKYMIGYSSVFAFIAAISAFWTIEPKISKKEE